MLKRTITILMLTAMLLVPGQLALAGGGHSTTTEALVIEHNDYEVSLVFEPLPLATGKTGIHLEAKYQGKPIEAEIRLTAEMMHEEGEQGHGHGKEEKPEVIFSAQGDGVYEGTLKIAEPGEWKFVLEITEGEKFTHIDFTSEVKSSGPNLVFLAMIANVIVLAIVCAEVINQRRKAVVAHG